MFQLHVPLNKNYLFSRDLSIKDHLFSLDNNNDGISRTDKHFVFCSGYCAHPNFFLEVENNSLMNKSSSNKTSSGGLQNHT